MTDHDLERLKSLAVPPARPEARRRALDAALAAFERQTTGGAQAPSEAEPPVAAASVGSHQARLEPGTPGLGSGRSAGAPRQHGARAERRDGWMRRPELAAMAAAIAFVAVGVPLTALVLRPAPLEHELALTGGRISGPQASDAARRIAALPAPTAAAPHAPPPSAPASAPQAPVGPAATSGAGHGATAVEVRPAPKAPARSRSVEARRKADADEHERRAAERSLRGTETASAMAPPAREVRQPAAPPAAAHVPSRPGAAGIADAGGGSQRRARADPDPSPVKPAARGPVSTFPLEVGTASYGLVRRALQAGQLPPREDVRIEEMVNAFHYAWPAPASSASPVLPTVTVLPSPWNPANRLLHIAVRSYGQKSDGPVAGDVQVEVVLDPAGVADYRLISAEPPAPRPGRQDSGKAEGRDIASGRLATAIYEITPAGAPGMAVAGGHTSDAARTGPPEKPGIESRPEARREAAAPVGSVAASDGGTRYASLLLRYKRPGETASRRIELTVGPALEHRELATVPADVRFSVAVAAFGQLLRGSRALNGFTFDDVIALAEASKGDDPDGRRAEMIGLLQLARSARR